MYRINEEVLRFIVIKYESKKEQKAWDAYIAENADQIRKKLGDNLSAEIARYFADKGL